MQKTLKKEQKQAKKGRKRVKKRKAKKNKKIFKKVLTNLFCSAIIVGQITSADLAHLVERHLAKVEVAGSSPVIRSKKYRRNCLRYFFIQTAGLVYHHALACISSAPLELYIITRKSVFSCGLM